MVEALVDSVVDGAIGEKTCETTAARVEQTLVTLDVEVRILLAGEARRREILGGRGAPDGEADVLAVLLLKLAVCSQNLAGQVVGESSAVDDLPRTFGFPRQRGDVGGVDVVELGVQPVPGTCLVQHVAIGRSGDGEPVRNADVLAGQLLEHLAQRSVLAADERHVLDADLLEKADVPGRTHDLSSHCAPRTPVRRLLPHTAPHLPTSHGGGHGARVEGHSNR